MLTLRKLVLVHSFLFLFYMYEISFFSPWWYLIHVRVETVSYFELSVVLIEDLVSFSLKDIKIFCL